MDLILVNNDPTRTLLVSSDGIPVYSVGTLPSVPVPSQANTTTVTRLERGSSSSSGRTQAEVGRIQYQTDDPNVRLSLNQCLEERPEFSLEIVKEFESGGDDEQNQRQNSWSFTGPDDRPYKWQIFIQYPILFLDDTSKTPLARYRRAKLGIVSRPRRPFLEIFPAGIACVDLVVVTFVSFMIHRFPALGLGQGSASEQAGDVP